MNTTFLVHRFIHSWGCSHDVQHEFFIPSSNHSPPLHNLRGNYSSQPPTTMDQSVHLHIPPRTRPSSLVKSTSISKARQLPNMPLSISACTPTTSTIDRMRPNGIISVIKYTVPLNLATIVLLVDHRPPYYLALSTPPSPSTHIVFVPAHSTNKFLAARWCDFSCTISNWFSISWMVFHVTCDDGGVIYDAMFNGTNIRYL